MILYFFWCICGRAVFNPKKCTRQRDRRLQRQRRRRRLQRQRFWPPMFDPLSCRAANSERDDVSHRVVHALSLCLCSGHGPRVRLGGKKCCDDDLAYGNLLIYEHKNTLKCFHYKYELYGNWDTYLAAAINMAYMASRLKSGQEIFYQAGRTRLFWRMERIKNRPKSDLVARGYIIRSTAGVVIYKHQISY